MAKLIFDPFHNIQSFSIVLAHRDLSYYGYLINVSDIKYTCNLNSANEISFVVHKYADDRIEDLWDDIIDLRLVYVKDIDEYFECQVSMDDSTEDVVKTVTGTSLCEAELSQYMIYDLSINDEEDITNFTELNPGQDYQPTMFYDNSDIKHSLLHRVINDFAPNYTIGYVDESLKSLQRSFTVNGDSVYDFLIGDVAEQLNCLFKFDSTTRTISVYDLYSECTNPYCNWLTDRIEYVECQNPNCRYFKDNHQYYRMYSYMDQCPVCESSSYLIQHKNQIPYRGEFTDKCPKCGDTHIKYYGDDTSVLIDKDNFTESINFTTDTDSIKNTFRLVGGDDNITDLLSKVNPNGFNKIIYFSEDQKRDMPSDLVSKWETYQELVDSWRDTYRSHVLTEWNCIDQINYFTHSMMPTREDDDTSALNEYNTLLRNLRNYPPALEEINSTTSTHTVTTLIKNYGKIFLKTGYYKLSTANESFNYSTKTWTGTIIVTNYKEETDVYPTGNSSSMGTINIQISDNIERYIDNKVKLIIKQEQDNENDDESSIFDVLSIEDLSRFREAITYYSLERLESFVAALEGVQTTLNEMQISTDFKIKNGDLYKLTNKTYAELYDEFYVPIIKKLAMLQGAPLKDEWKNEPWVDSRWRSSGYITGEIVNREDTINFYKETRSIAETQQKNINYILDIERNLGTDNYKLLQAYLRVQDYSNDNFISDGLNNSEVYEKCRELAEQASIDIVKSAEYQHSISADLSDLLTLEEFIPFLDSFEVGNFIRVKSDNQLYRLRLISYEIDFEDLSHINVEFSDMTKSAFGLNDIGSVMSLANSMATSYGYIQKQSKDGVKANKVISNYRQYGLNSSLYHIKNNVNEEIVMNNTGLSLKNYVPESDSYSPDQIRITHNIICFTDDNWYHSKMALGNFEYVDEFGTAKNGYGVNADFLISGYIDSATIVASKLYSRSGDSEATKNVILDLDNNYFRLGQENDYSLKYENGNFTFGSNVKLSWNQVQDQPNFVTQQDQLDLQSSLTQAAQNYADRAANIALEEAKKDATTKANTAEENAKADATSKANSAETNAKDYSSGLIAPINTTLQNATDRLTSAETTLSNLSNTVSNLNFATRQDIVNELASNTTILRNNEVISPKIGGGYLFIVGKNGGVEINPNAETISNKYNNWVRNSTYPVFNVRNKNDKIVMGIDTSGNGYFTGQVIATSGSFTGEVTATSGSFTGKVYASQGRIGNNILCENAIYQGNLGGYGYYSGFHNPSTYNDVIFFAGVPKNSINFTYDSSSNIKTMSFSNVNLTNSQFYVTADGKVYANEITSENQITLKSSTRNPVILLESTSTGVAPSVTVKTPLKQVSLHVGRQEQNRGLYDWSIGSSGKWLIYADGNNNIQIPDSLNVSNNITASSITTSDNIYVQKSSFPAQVQVKSGSRIISLHIGSGGNNRGIYDNQNGRWIIYSTDNSTSVYVPKGEVLTTSVASGLYQPKGNYLTSHQSLSAYLTTSSASSIYLTKTSASSTYLTKTSASSTYLDKSGGTTTGEIYVSKEGIRLANNIPIYFTDSGDKKPLVRRYELKGSDGHTWVNAFSNNFNYTHIWSKGNVFKGASTTTYLSTTTSDERLKANISYLDKYEKIFYLLEPISFKYRDDLQYTYHTPKIKWGLSAQRTINLFTKYNLDWHDYELIVQDDAELSDTEKKYISDYKYGINYENLISLNIHMIQKQKKEIDQLSIENEKIKQRMLQLENMIFMLMNKKESQNGIN